MITFNEAMTLTEKYESFRHKLEYINGKTFHIFSYMLADRSAFADHKNNKSLEMRGLTFLETPNDSEPFKRFLGIKKFFNVNETPWTQYEDLKDKEIAFTQEKFDGSLIMPILVDGQIHCKTIKSFHNEQAHTANKILEKDSYYRSMIKRFYRDGKIPFFELTSPNNRIVLDYEKTELRLIQVRDLKTGKIENLNEYGSVIPHHIHFSHSEYENTLKELMDLATTVKNFEGWVVTYKNGMQVKVKTYEYCDLHKLVTESITRENDIIRWILQKKFDDILAKIPSNDTRREYAISISDHLFDYTSSVTNNLMNIYLWTLENTRKEIAIKYNKHEYFVTIMELINFKERGIKFTIEDIFKLVDNLIIHRTQKLDKAKEFLTKSGFNVKIW